MTPLVALLVLAPEKPIDVNVVVLNYDPIFESEGGKRMHEVFKWNDPHMLADGYAKDVEEASHGRVKFHIREWRDLDEWQAKKDGFRYTDETYLSVMRDHTTTGHDPDGIDYAKSIEEQKLVPDIDSRKFDEVWMFGFPYAGYFESAMAGPRSFWINGDTIPTVPSKRPFAIMGFNYERGVAEMIHDNSHRSESTMARIYGRWEKGKPTNPWEAFSAFEQNSPSYAAVGNCHFPPNAEKDYDYANKRTVMSSADGWLTYPKVGDRKKPVTCETWGGPDYQRNYLIWWFKRLPHVPGVAKDGRQNDWWKYVYRFDDYDEHGLPIKR